MAELLVNDEDLLAADYDEVEEEIEQAAPSRKRRKSAEDQDELIYLAVENVVFELAMSEIMEYPEALLATMFMARNRALVTQDSRGAYVFKDRKGFMFSIIHNFYLYF